MNAQSRNLWRRFLKNHSAVGGAILILFMALVALAGPSIRPDSSENANDQNLRIANQHPGFTVGILDLNAIPDVGKKLAVSNIRSVDSLAILYLFNEREPNKDSIALSSIQLRSIGVNRPQDLNQKIKNRTFVLGTDKYGRDVLSRLMAGTIISLSVGLIAVTISLLLGILLGLIAGYFGGFTDWLVSWFINVVWAIPTLLLVMVITLAFGSGLWKVFIAVGLTMWVEVARIVRGQVLVVKQLEYIEAARMLGFGHFRIMFSHILPNIWSPIIVISAANFASAILMEAGLSFLGIGAKIPTPSWGNMIRENYALITTDMAYLALAPGILIMLLVLSFMLVGNGLRDALEVKE